MGEQEIVVLGERIRLGVMFIVSILFIFLGVYFEPKEIIKDPISWILFISFLVFIICIMKIGADSRLTEFFIMMIG